MSKDIIIEGISTKRETFHLKIRGHYWEMGEFLNPLLMLYIVVATPYSARPAMLHCLIASHGYEELKFYTKRS